MKIKPRGNKQKKGVFNSTSNSVIEVADFISETAESFRRSMTITNVMLKGLQGEVYLDSVATLMERGLSQAEAIDLMESL